jgi:hypothetical protein
MNRVLGLANTQARVRARLGELPGPEFWRELADIPRLDGVLDRLRVSGLSFWVNALPRRPEPVTLERHLADRWRARRRETARLLPGTWERLRGWLAVGMSGPTGAPAGTEVPGTSPVGEEIYFRTWAGDAEWRDLRRAFRGRPADIARRLERLWRAHAEAIAVRRAAHFGAGEDPDEQWLLRARLERGLRDLAAGDPFHPALVMILLDLEWIQFERVRALVLARAYGWPAPRFLPN